MAKTKKAKSAKASGTKTTKKSKRQLVHQLVHDPTLRTRGGTPKRSKPVSVPRKPRQAVFDEMEQPQLARVENAARDYAEARDARMSMGEEEQRRHTKLIAIMKDEGLSVYKHRTGGEVIEVKVAAKDATAKAKVRIYDADEAPATQTTEPAVGGEQEPAVEGDAVQDETLAEA